MALVQPEMRGIAEATRALAEALGAGPAAAVDVNDPRKGAGLAQAGAKVAVPGFGAPGFKDPLPQRERPRSMVVGPGSPDSSGIASQQVVHSRVHSPNDPGKPHIHRIDVTGSNGTTAWAEYDATGGEIIGWGGTERHEDGAVVQETRAYTTDAAGNVVVETKRVTTTSDGETRTEVEQRAPRPTDPPQQDPQPERTPPPPAEGADRTRTGEEGGAGGLPLGLEVNPITGQVSGGMKLDGDRGNPGREQPALAGPRLSIDPHILVVNPDPFAGRIQGGASGSFERPDPGARPPTGDQPPKP